ncbi:methionyl-tRNA formyltransferase [Aureibaculum sp. 2210JD6-5]|uniref:methionyl-tRNA formyltransferase n=1 Tax=Aureibaculum sp. 2210JD6-5 TaxID=3103957 RepID=UPI002AAC660A|nr:methionyl-tRNA formyltransferase [Aureibaculum sp. 2210JD6-5]MDY7395160.1 methionyl-tRNA formyltransferase [Aureibaculum sp. 2210JD6-5]
MTELRIVFMGTPDFAVGVLKTLIDHNYNVVGVITAPDRPSGRGRKLNQSAVKKYALEQNLNILQPTNLKDELFLAELNKLNANLQIVVAFRMLPKVVWQMPALGTFNLHASLLPNYRGAAPINWVIINGETKTGVTTFFIDDKIDTGAIILKEEIAIDKNDTAGTLHDKLMQLGSKLVIETVKLIEKGEVKPVQQRLLEDNQLKDAPKIFKDTCQIHWNKSIDEIYDKIRGLNPYPGAWTDFYNDEETLEMKIYDVKKEKEKHHHSIGKLIADKTQLKVAVNKGFIIIEKLQLPGKRKMRIGDLLNGYKIGEKAYVKS